MKEEKGTNLTIFILVVGGILFSLTGIGALIGIPMIIIGAVGGSVAKKEEHKKALLESLQPEASAPVKGFCPHCHQELHATRTTPGLDCLACNNRVIIRNGAFLTIDQAKEQAIEEQQDSSSTLAKQGPSMEGGGGITKETFNPLIHVAEYKRVCNSCGKAWHSLVDRERSLEKDEACYLGMAACSACGDMGASMQAGRNADAQKGTLKQLKKCPDCGSENYAETVLYYVKKN